MSEQKTINSTRLINILRTFDKEELKQLDKFVRSPYFNTNLNVSTLFGQLKKHAPHFSSEILKVALFNKIYTKKYNKQTVLSASENRLLNDLVHKLTKLVEEFLAYDKFDKKEIYKHSLTIDNLLEKKLTDEVNSIFRKAESALKKMPHKDRDYYQDLFLLNESHFHHKMLLNNRAKDVGMQEVINSLQKTSLTNLIRLYCAALNREKICNVHYSYPLMDSLIEYIREDVESQEPIVQIYYHILMVMKGSDVGSHFLKLKESIKVFGSLFHLHELRQMYIFIVNYCVRRIKAGGLEYKEELFTIYQNSLNPPVWNSSMHFSSNTFMLIAKSALNVNRPDWLIEFIEKYKAELNPKHQITVPALAYAHLHFHLKDFDKSMENLLRVDNHVDFIYNFYYRILEIKIAFEQTVNFNSPSRKKKFLTDKIEALRFFIDRKKNNKDKTISETNLTNYGNFYKLVRRLAVIKTEKPLHFVPLEKVAKLLLDIKQEDSLEERDWLQEKAEELLKKKK